MREASDNYSDVTETRDKPPGSERQKVVVVDRQK
jgi:hypothetical protein